MSEGVNYPNLAEMLNEWGDITPDDDDHIAHCERVEAELAAAERTAVRLERMSDLVRYKRAELHNDGLISDEEYAEICQDHAAVARLEGYDAIKEELKEARAVVQKFMDLEYSRYRCEVGCTELFHIQDPIEDVRDIMRLGQKVLDKI